MTEEPEKEISQNRFKTIGEEISKLSQFKENDYELDSPKEEGILKKFFSGFKNNEINIQDNSEEDDEDIYQISPRESDWSQYFKEAEIPSKSIKSKGTNESNSDGLDSFRKEHNKIVNEEIKNSSYYPKISGRLSSGSSSSKGKRIKHKNSVYTVKKNKLSISIETEKKSLSISMEEEINTKKLQKKEVDNLKSKTDQMFGDESSINEVLKDWGSILKGKYSL